MTATHAGSLSVGDVVFGEVDEYGVEWFLESLAGWWESPGSSGVVEQRNVTDGGWISPAYMTPRTLEASGALIAPDFHSASLALDRLKAAVPLRQLSTVSVDEGARTLVVAARQTGEMLVDRRDGWARFSLSLIAPDPRKYDATSRNTSLVLPLLTGGIAPPLTPPFTVTGSTSRSQVTLTNDGNITTYPTLVLVGPCPPATVANLTTGEALRIVDAVPADQTLVIDVLNGTATNGGQARRVLGSWWGLAPGANEVALTADGYDAGAQLLVSYRSAWK